jgi:hypothetical protein
MFDANLRHSIASLALLIGLVVAAAPAGAQASVEDAARSARSADAAFQAQPARAVQFNVPDVTVVPF